MHQTHSGFTFDESWNINGKDTLLHDYFECFILKKRLKTLDTLVHSWPTTCRFTMEKTSSGFSFYFLELLFYRTGQSHCCDWHLCVWRQWEARGSSGQQKKRGIHLPSKQKETSGAFLHRRRQKRSHHHWRMAGNLLLLFFLSMKSLFSLISWFVFFFYTSSEWDSVREEEEASPPASPSSRKATTYYQPSGPTALQRLGKGDETGTVTSTWLSALVCSGIVWGITKVLVSTDRLRGHGMRVWSGHLLSRHAKAEGQCGQFGKEVQKGSDFVHWRRSQRCEHDQK